LVAGALAIILSAEQKETGIAGAFQWHKITNTKNKPL
jgi:hypothetical protein